MAKTDMAAGGAEHGDDIRNNRPPGLPVFTGQRALIERNVYEQSTAGPPQPRPLIARRDHRQHQRRASAPEDTPSVYPAPAAGRPRRALAADTGMSGRVITPVGRQDPHISSRYPHQRDVTTSPVRRPPPTHPSPSALQAGSPRSPIAPSPDHDGASPALGQSRWNRVQMASPAQPPAAHGSPTPGFSPYSSPQFASQYQPNYNNVPNWTLGARRQAYIERGSDDDSDDCDEIDLEEDYRRPKTLHQLQAEHGSSERSFRRRANYRYGEDGEDLNRSQESRSSSDGNKKRTVQPHEMLDEDDPRVTGKKVNRVDDEKRATDSFIKGGDDITSDGSYEEKRAFILRLAKALMRYGAPSHRLESQLAAAARVTAVEASFVHLPSLVIVSIGDGTGQNHRSETHFVKAAQGLSLGKLHDVHLIYRSVMHHDIGVAEGTRRLDALLTSAPLYGLRMRILIAFMCTFLICPLAFHGSLIDALVSGCGGAILCWLQLHVAKNNPLYANVFEISIAILMAFVARALSSIRSHMFCYDAISSSGVVLILPGYTILCSALELASKNIVCGSVRMIYAIIYSLFLGFGLTIGSDFYLLLDAGARKEREMAAISMETLIELHGLFHPDNVTTPFSGTFSFSNETSVSSPEIIEGCYREPTWPWWLQEFPWWTLFILVPTFSFFSSLGNMQPFKTKELPVMVIISCASFAANTAANAYIFNRSDIVSAIGAFVVGVLGNLYSRAFKGTAFTAMVTGILFLVPSGLSAAGGLANNYHGQDVDQYSNGLQIGVRMVQVAIGITVGVFGSGLLVYSFGSRKTGGTFAF